MQIPAIWTTPNNPATRVSVFRVEVDRKEGGDPSIKFYLDEAGEIGATSFKQYRPELTMSSSLSTMLLDPDIATSAQQVASGLEQMAYVLYLRMKASMEAKKI